MQQRVIYPDKNKWAELELSKEKKIVYNRFNADDFPIEWEMYIRPHLNGLRPDLVLLHSKFGIAVYEFIQEKDQQIIIETIESDITINNPFIKVELYEKELLDFYCPRLGIMYEPAGDRYRSKHQSVSQAITVGLIFTEFSQTEIDGIRACLIERLKTGGIFTESPQVVDGLINRLHKYKQYYPLVGSDNLDNLNVLFPKKELNLYSYKMETSASILFGSKPEDTAADLRAWLTEYVFYPYLSTPLKLNDDQVEIATERTSTGYRRVKGPAGSGRSVALTARAVELDRQNKRVLVCTYNITLVNYLRYLIARHARGQEFFRRQIDVFYFHDWCLHVCRSAGRSSDYTKFLNEIEKAKKAMVQAKGTPDYKDLKQAWQDKKDEVFEKHIPELIQDIYKNSPKNNVLPFYDAILVDEGQDFRLNWWNTLRESVTSDGEKLLVADKTQDIYGNAAAWTDGPMPGAGFPGGTWKQLHTHYRLPFTVVSVLKNMKQMKHFQEFDIPLNEHVVDSNLFPVAVKLRWRQTDLKNAVDHCFDEVCKQRNMLQLEGHLDYSDITFLSANNSVGSQFVKLCKDKGIGVRDTFGIANYSEDEYLFDDENLSRLKKRLFFPGDTRMKATTLHSFKGFESSHLVVYVERIDWPSTRALLYVGLTRLKIHPKISMLTVVSSCLDKELCKFAKDNFEFDPLEG